MEEERCPSYTNQQGSHMSESEETPEHLQYQEDEEMIHGEHEDDVELKATMRAARDKEEQQIKELACLVCGERASCDLQCQAEGYRCARRLEDARRVWEKGYRKIDLKKLTIDPEFDTDYDRAMGGFQLTHTKQQIQQQLEGQK
jgi:hypothetical protein